MKLIAAIALTCMPMMAMAGDPDEIIPTKQECDAIFPFSMIEEKANGENCPATGFEEGVGQVLFGATVLVIGIEAIGGDVFPLNAGVFSGL